MVSKFNSFKIIRETKSLLMKTPPVVENKVANRQKGNQEPGGPSGLETNNNHNTSNK
jgi:hypothetical protein